METRTDPLRALRAGWWILPVVLVAALGSAAFLDDSGEERLVYQTQATLAVVPDSSVTNPNQMLRSVEVLERRTMVSTLSRIPASGPVRGLAAQRMGTSLRDLRAYRVRTRVLPSTHLIGVTVHGPDPGVAARFANAIAAVAGDEANGYYRVFSLRLLDDAGVPGRPTDRDGKRTYAVAGVLGLFLGAGAAYGVGLVRLT